MNLPKALVYALPVLWLLLGSPPGRSQSPNPDQNSGQNPDPGQQPVPGVTTLGTQTPSAKTAQQSTQQSNKPNAYTWKQLKAMFEANNPQLKADQSMVEESRAQEITARLRPNPQFLGSSDGLQLNPNNGVWQPLAGVQEQANFSYLHERDHKRELRTEAAKDTTLVNVDNHLDLIRNMEFNLRGAYVQTLQAKAVLKLAEDDLAYYDKIIDISRYRFKDGDIAQVDLDRIELQRVQYESELQNAMVNLRTSKISLLMMLNERTPVDQFDVEGTFDFSPDLKDLEEFRQEAMAVRPDLKAAVDQIEQSVVSHKLAIANGSTDPTFGAWWTHNGSYNNPNAENSLGLSVTIPLRVFDRNQGEKKRTLIDIDHSEQLTEAKKAQVFSDVDTAHAQLATNIALLKPYKDKYLQQSTRVRDTVTYAYQHGGASLTDFLNAQSDYRVVQLAYLQLIGSYLTAASQLNLAVGREVIP
jgi:cobalt-zinc-cadmium efflux system outer membrane protein